MKIVLTILGEPALIERFEGLVVREPTSGCWLWTGAPSDSSLTGQYGRFRVHGKQWKAHRAAWALYRGPIPDLAHVLHRCDNQACVNPAHLFLGTNDDNVRDRVVKGRSGGEAHPGERHPMRKLDEPAVRSIRARFSAGEEGAALAKEFHVHKSTISEIVNRRKWRHVA